MEELSAGGCEVAAYQAEGERRARALSNRGPLRFWGDGSLDAAIREAYFEHGCYVFEGLLDAGELADLRSDFTTVLEHVPAAGAAPTEAAGRLFTYATPLSDSSGGDARSPVSMTALQPPADSPEQVLVKVFGPLQLMDSFLRLYGHPLLLRVAAAIHGPDFVPFAESIIVKQPLLGPAVAWHQAVGAPGLEPGNPWL